MYDCPIKTFIESVPGQIQQTYDGHILMAVQRVGIDVNREELLQAIHNDRQRYEKAFREGWNACEAHYQRQMEEIRRLTMKDGDPDA